MSEAKPFCISKKEVWEAYKRVKANKGAAGVDEQSIEDLEKKLKKNLYKIWNRMSSGSYFPPPVRTVKIPKKNVGERKLGIPTVADRIAQQVVKARLELEVEPLFHADSYGFRPGQSALDARASGCDSPGLLTYEVTSSSIVSARDSSTRLVRLNDHEARRRMREMLKQS